MNEQGFVDRRETDWQRLTVLCDRAETNVRKLTADELRELIRLYRRISTDLALARTKSTNAPLIAYLNDLAGRTYGVLYRAPRKPFWSTIVGAVATSAQTVRRNKWFVLLSALIFFGSSVFSFALMSWSPDSRDLIVPQSMDPLVKSWQSGEFEDRGISTSAFMAGFYAFNNPKTSVITGAIGAGTFGVGSVYLLFENGKQLGGLSYKMQEVHKMPFLISSVAPHGVTELSGIIVSGASGLLLAYAIINPGRRRRSAALKAVGKDAIVLLSTSVVLMFIAAPIEGFFSFQGSIPQEAKAVFALCAAAAWAAFWIGFGREKQPQASVAAAEAA